MSNVTYLHGDLHAEKAWTLFRAARNGECVAALGRDAALGSVLVRARSLLRLDDPFGALDSLRQIEPPYDDVHHLAEYHVLSGLSLARCGRGNDAGAQFGIAEHSTRRAGGAAAAELALCRAAGALIAGDVDSAMRIAVSARNITPVPEDPYSIPFAVIGAELLDLLADLAAYHEDLRAAAVLLVEAWNMLCPLAGEQRDVWLQASVLRKLAPLVLDLHLVDEAAVLGQEASRIQWAPEIRTARYVVSRVLAWHAALRGDHFAAFARFRECIDLAPADPWLVASMLDRANLAAELRERVIHREEMLRAGDLARSIEWAGVVADENRIQLDLAEAYARNDPALARYWLDRFSRDCVERESTFAGIVNDHPRTAAQHDATGAVLASEGRIAEGVTKHRAALVIWDGLQFGWRAARTALAIARLTRSPGDASSARERAAAFRGSWLARRARNVQ